MKTICDLGDQSVASLYLGVPAEAMARFQAFRRDFPHKEHIREGAAWPYIAGGRGAPPLLYLPGALGEPELSWPLIAALASRRRVVAPTYTPTRTMAQLVDGIAAIARAEGMERLNVIGCSYGGAVAQIFARRNPLMVRSLALARTQPPIPEMARRLGRFASSLRLRPMGMARRALRRTLAPTAPLRREALGGEEAFALAAFDELVGLALDREDMIGVFERMADYSRARLDRRDLAAWRGRVLLLFEADDPSTPPALRRELELLYPGCRSRVLEASGRTTAAERMDAFIAAIEDFLSF